MSFDWIGRDSYPPKNVEWPQDMWTPQSGVRAPQQVADWLPDEGKRPVCSAPGCNALGKFWKRTGRPIFEGQWACGRKCLTKLVETAVWREMGSGTAAERNYRHRVPLGLVLLAQGVISQAQLQKALALQKREGRGRIGEWLIDECDVAEEQVTRALSVQWNCPVLPMKGFEPRTMALVMPQRLRQVLSVLPVRLAGGKLLYLGAEEKIDAAAALVLEQMSGLTVETGVIGQREMADGTERMNTCPQVECLETQVKSSSSLIDTLTSTLLQAQPIASRIVRLHEFVWVRMWLERAAVGRFGTLPASGEDVVDLLYQIGTVPMLSQRLSADNS